MTSKLIAIILNMFKIKGIQVKKQSGDYYFISDSKAAVKLLSQLKYVRSYPEHALIFKGNELVIVNAYPNNTLLADLTSEYQELRKSLDSVTSNYQTDIDDTTMLFTLDCKNTSSFELRTSLFIIQYSTVLRYPHSRFQASFQ